MELLNTISMLLTSIISSLLIIGLDKSMQDGYILSKVRELAEIEADKSDLIRFILTPLCLCVYCMSSAWTIIVQLVIGFTGITPLLCSIFMTLGFVVLFKSIIEQDDY